MLDLDDMVNELEQLLLRLIDEDTEVLTLPAAAQWGQDSDCDVE